MTRLDKIIFVSAFLLSFALMFFLNIKLPSGDEKSVVIEVNGEVYGKYELNAEKTDGILEIKTEYGYNKVVIDEGVEIVESDCKDALCLHKKITQKGAMLVCLPSRLVIRITGGGGVDGVAY